MLSGLKRYLKNLLVALLKDQFDAVSLGVTEVKVQNNVRDVQLKDLDASLSGLHSDLALTNTSLNKIRDSVTAMQSAINFNERFAASIQAMPPFDYLGFEDKFRGPEIDVKVKQRVFSKYFLKSSAVLDIGCGRGEFLEVLKEEKVQAIGIDNDIGMVKHCQQKGLQVTAADMFQFLLDAKDASFDGVFCSQVIEHLTLEQLKLLMYLLSKKVRKGAPILLETPNPRCSQAMESFYTDMTHVRPILPESIAFMAENYGLRVKLFIFSSPINAELAANTQDVALQRSYGDYAIILEP